MNKDEVAPEQAGRVPPNATVAEIAAVFLRDGYILIPDLIPNLIQPTELDALREDTDEIVFGGWQRAEMLRRAARAPRLCGHRCLCPRPFSPADGRH